MLLTELLTGRASNLAEVLRFLREGDGRSQEAMARDAGLTVAAMAPVLAGEDDMSAQSDDPQKRRFSEGEERLGEEDPEKHREGSFGQEDREA